LKHVTIEAFDCPDAWFQTVSKIWNEGEIFIVGHGSECTETKKLDVTIHIKRPEYLPLVADKAPTDMKHVQEYGLTYLWTDFLGEHPYTYGWRLQHPINQIQSLINAILLDERNRQLTMTIRIPEDVINPEPPCLTMIDIEVLNSKVNLTSYFRSWDAYAGLPENIAGLWIFLDAFVKEINEHLSATSQLQTGEMILHSKNCHIYKRQYNLVKELVEIHKNNEKRLAEVWKTEAEKEKENSNV
jgi:thymidylate synthase